MDRTVLAAGLSLAFAVAVVAVAVAPVALSPDRAGTPEPPDDTVPTPDEDSRNGSGGNVTVGQQLSTIIELSSGEIQTDIENAAFRRAFGNVSDSTQATVIRERLSNLENETGQLHRAYRAATAGYENGTFSESEYARRLASLDARAADLLRSYELLQRLSSNVSSEALRTAGVDEDAFTPEVADLSGIDTNGSNALLKQFTGEADGEFTIDTADGLRVEVETEDGERSREIDRPRDDDDRTTVPRSAALETAQATLSSVDNASWTLENAAVDQSDGSYAFVFSLESPTTTGEADVSVDGSSGRVFSLDEELEPAESDDESEEADENDSEEIEDDE